MDERKIQWDLLQPILKPYEKLFDIVRIIDPMKKNIFLWKDDKDLSESIACNSLWSKCQVCDNCIVIKTLNEKKTFTKIQYNANKMYLIFTTFLEINNETLILELLKDVTDNLIFETVDIQDGNEVRNITQDLNALLLRDILTNLYNRRYINQMLPYEISKSFNKNYPISIAMVDIDNFKKINDTYGHNFGDKVIKRFGQVLKRYTRDEQDWVARYGGDEFLIFLHNADSKKAYRILERMRRAVERMSIRVNDEKINITGSFGGYTLKESELNALDYIKYADDRLYEAKNKGRNKVII